MRFDSVRRTAVLAAVLSLAACASAEDPSEGGGPAPSVVVTSEDIDGRFELVELRLDNEQVGLENEPRLLIDGSFGSLEVQLGCNTRYGSFTIGGDGNASFTVPGGTSQDCEGFVGQEAAITEALDRVESWSATGDGVAFTGPGASITTVGPTPIG